MSLPLVVNEDQVHTFHFYSEGRIYQGLTFQAELYLQVQLFAEVGRLKAYTLADYLQEKSKVLIVVSKTHYRVALDLRSGIRPSEAAKVAYDLAQSLSSQGLFQEPTRSTIIF